MMQAGQYFVLISLRNYGGPAGLHLPHVQSVEYVPFFRQGLHCSGPAFKRKKGEKSTFPVAIN